MAPWYAHYPADYERKTSHLTMLEDGAYRRMLDHYYASSKPLPLGADHLYRICRAFSDDERNAIDRVLKQFFVRKADGYHNKRADQEIRKAKALIQAKRAAGKAGGLASRGKSGRKPNSSAIADELQKNTHPQSLSQSHTQTPITQPIPHEKQESKKAFSYLGNGSGNGTTTIENPHERVARFQQKIAQALGPIGWETVTAACTRSDPKHEASLAICKQTARSLKKGWPKLWPIN